MFIIVKSLYKFLQFVNKELQPIEMICAWDLQPAPQLTFMPVTSTSPLLTPLLRKADSTGTSHLGKQGIPGFKGWLARWKKRYNVNINGESGDARGKTANSWKEKISELLQEYLSENRLIAHDIINNN